MLKRKMLRDLWKNKSQFINIFIMILLACFAYTGVHAYMDGMQVSGYKYYEENNLQDLWLTKESFSREDIEKIKSIDNVNDAERLLTINTNVEGFEDTVIQLNFIESNNVNKFYVAEGEGFDNEKDGIWLDSYFAKAREINIGDEITLKYEDYTITKEVLGIIYVPDHVYSIKDSSAILPVHDKYGFAYANHLSFPMDENFLIYSQAIVDIEDTDKLGETKKKIENEIDGIISVTDRESSASYVSYNNEIEEGQTYSFVFTVMFTVIAALSIVTTMHRFVSRERSQIGTLKALGFSNRKIIMHYLSYCTFLSIIAAIIGMILGALLIGNTFMETEMKYYEVPDYSIAILPTCYIMSICIIIATSLVTYLATRKILKEPAASALRIETPSGNIASDSITTKGIFKKLSLSSRWNIRDIMRSKGRTIVAIVGILGCVMLVVAGFGLKDTMESYVDWEFEIISNYKYKLDLSENITAEQLQNLIDKYGDATSENLAIEVKLNKTYNENNIEETKATNLLVGDTKDYIQMTDHDLNVVEWPNDGIIVTEKFAQNYGFSEGDEIEWKIYGEDEWQKTKIVYLDREPQVQQLKCTKEFFEKVLEKEYKADTLYTNEDLSEVKELDGVDVIKSSENLKSDMIVFMDTINLIIIVLIIASIILAFVIIFNLGSLSFSEKEYQFATLKVLGFQTSKIKKIFIQQNIWISIIGILLGLPLGYVLIDFMFKDALGENYDMSAQVPSYIYVVAGIGALIVTLVINILLARKIKNIDMVSSLKANE